MSLIYVTGVAGSGKSAVQKELSRRGYHALDGTGDNIAGFFDKETGERITHTMSLEKRTPQWRATKDWKIPRSFIEKLKASSSKPMYICAFTDNDKNELWDLFDQVFALVTDEATLRHRLAARTNSNIGKRPDELATILRARKTAETDYKNLGAIIVDATQPVDAVVDEILRKTNKT